MHQELSSPIEEIGFARVQFRCALVLPHAFERIAQSLLDVAEQVMKFGFVLLLNEQASNICARTLVFTGAGISERQFVGVFVIAGIELRSPLEVGERFASLSVIDERFPEAVICVKV